MTSTRVFHLKVQSLFKGQSLVFSEYFRRKYSVFAALLLYFSKISEYLTAAEIRILMVSRVCTRRSVS